MRIPFDLIAAILCVEGIGAYLQGLMPQAGMPTNEAVQDMNLVSAVPALLAWAGFILVSWLLNELVIRHVEWRIRFGLHISGYNTRRHPLVTLGWGTYAAQAVTVALYALILWDFAWPLWVTQWPTWFGLAPDAHIGGLQLASSKIAELPLNLLPFLLAMLVGWIPRRRLSAGIRGHSVPLWKFLGFEARLTWPLVVLNFAEKCFSDLKSIFPPQYTEWASRPGIDILLAIGVMAFVWMIAMPKFIIWLWQCKPLPAGNLKDRLVALTQRSGVRAREILVWGPRNSNLLNACVMGPWARFRYVLISPALTDELTAEETEAVLAHELGHARYGHLTLLFVMMLFLVALIDPVLLLLPKQWQDSPLIQAGVVLSILVIYIRIIFGGIMRQCEREADLASAEFMGTHEPLVTALEKLGKITGNIRNVWSWHHGSLAERVANVEKLSADPAQSQLFHDRLRRFRIAFAVLTFAALCAQFLVRF